MLSLPSRGAWIEILEYKSPYGRQLSLPSRGAWIEIIVLAEDKVRRAGRSPHGERGLKSPLVNPPYWWSKSLPSRGAWIEMPRHRFRASEWTVAPLTGSVD